ncbi:hypothetical protein BDN70DRAFT_559551 [Pholiota conissans]|uniref:Uncharacterized protein n=1 Tax=Pholiota conissans TaxID=109636 RepID=A0A9P5Z853_9AGAR|nr:hypothetical protein BDN70DRAFT_559551 [Pholiota conissans]
MRSSPLHPAPCHHRFAASIQKHSSYGVSCGCSTYRSYVVPSSSVAVSANNFLFLLDIRPVLLQSGPQSEIPNRSIEIESTLRRSGGYPASTTSLNHSFKLPSSSLISTKLRLPPVRCAFQCSIRYHGPQLYPHFSNVADLWIHTYLYQYYQTLKRHRHIDVIAVHTQLYIRHWPACRLYLRGLPIHRGVRKPAKKSQRFWLGGCMAFERLGKPMTENIS